MIDELDWSRKYINKQVNRLRGMFKWASAKEIIEASVSTALRELAGLKKGRTRARETEKVTSVCDSDINATLKFLPEIVADMVRIQRLTSARPARFVACLLLTLMCLATFGSTNRPSIRQSILRRIASWRSDPEHSRFSSPISVIETPIRSVFRPLSRNASDGNEQPLQEKLHSPVATVTAQTASFLPNATPRAFHDWVTGYPQWANQPAASLAVTLW